MAWLAGIALDATSPAAVAPPPALLDSLRRGEGIMAYRMVNDSTATERIEGFPSGREVRSSAIEGELKDRWVSLLTAPGLAGGPDCQPVCLHCADHVRYRLSFPPVTDSFSVNVLWDEHLVEYVDGRHMIAHRALGRGDTAWVTLLQATFPTDSVTHALRATDPVPRAKAEPSPLEELMFVDELPAVTMQVVPDYPRELLKRHASGRVIVVALVNANGRVREAFTRGPASVFDGSAIAAVRQWQFRAARCGSKRVAVWVAIPIRFTPE